VIAPARRAAYEALHAVTTGSLDLPAALSASRDRLRDPRDRALAGEIVIGALRWRAALDAVMAGVARRPMSKLDPEVADILRIGLYQLWHLQRVPPSAVVNDAVELTRVARRGRASALVNASLRAFCRSDPGAFLPPRPSDPSAAPDGALEYLSVALSHPRWLVSRLLARHGFSDTERWLQFNNAAAPLTLHVNPLKTSVPVLRSALESEGLVVELAQFAPGGLLVREGNPLGSPRHAAGDFIVQDEASQLVGHVVDARPGDRALDACAAPGGKTLVLWGDARGKAQIVAADVRPRRIALLRQTLARTAVGATVLQMDLRSGVPFRDVFDRVLVDAPCSGLGTVRRDPDIKWHREESELSGLASMQVTLLRNAAAAVRPGGRLVYATCSSEPEENDAVVEAFLSESRQFAPAGREWLADSQHGSRLAHVCDDGGRLRTFPHVHGLEAFFAAVLVKAKGV
jgi:16S rRNA (cytosine967-C5)-methyltransferase